MFASASTDSRAVPRTAVSPVFPQHLCTSQRTSCTHTSPLTFRPPSNFTVQTTAFPFSVCKTVKRSPPLEEVLEHFCVSLQRKTHRNTCNQIQIHFAWLPLLGSHVCGFWMDAKMLSDFWHVCLCLCITWDFSQLAKSISLTWQWRSCIVKRK